MDKVIVFDLSTEGLEPFKHRIIGITIKTENEEKIITERDEKTILEKFWSYLKNKEYKNMVGFNSSNFDAPMLIIRSIKHKVKIDNRFKERHMDLRQVIFGLEHKKGNLTDFKELLGMEFPENGYRKMHISLLWESNHLDELKEFLLRDVRITWNLYEHMLGAGLI